MYSCIMYFLFIKHLFSLRSFEEELEAEIGDQVTSFLF